MRSRLLLVLAVVVPAGFATKLYAGPAQSWVHGHAGGFLYVVFWCLLALALRPDLSPWLVGCAAFLVTSLFELLQLWHPPLLEAVRSSFLGHALIGSSFQWSDFPYYGAGALAAAGIARVCRARESAATLLVLLLTSSACGGEEGAPIVAPGAELERVFDGGHFLEGPAAAPDGSIYFSDLIFSKRSGMEAGHIWRFDPRSGRTSLFRSPSGMANGIAFDAKGQMWVAEGANFGGRRVTRTDMTTGKSYVAAGLFKDRPFNAPNDLSIDRSGRIYFTDPRYLGHEPVEQPVMGVYRIDPGGAVHRIVSELWKPNGIALSPDEKTLYVVTLGDFGLDGLRAPVPPTEQVPPSAIHAFDLDPEGRPGNRRAFVTYPRDRWADGITVDAAGNLYSAVSSTADQGGVYVYSPAGEEIGRIPTPEGAVNLEFGRGDEADVLYVTAHTSLYRIRLTKLGFHLPEPGRGP